MKVRRLAAAPLLVAALLAPATASAQTIAPGCVGQGLGEDACQKAADIFAFLAPQLAATIAGGNATLGQGGNLGGLGRFALSVRATALRGELPSVDEVNVAVGPAQATDFGVEEQWVGVPQVDLGIGIFRGFPLAISNVGGIDLLVSASWIPEVETDDVTLRATDGQFRFGGGVRLGILQESPTVPGVSITYLRRGLPTLDVTARAGDDTLSVLGTEVTVDSWRLVASKQLFAIGFAGGIGQDRYDSETSVSVVVNEPGVPRIAPPPAAFSQRMTRTNAFASLALHLGVVRLVGEVGSVWGGEGATFNTFSGSTPADERFYGSVGLRVGI